MSWVDFFVFALTTALQGAFIEHINHLNTLRHLTFPPFIPIEVRTKLDLAQCHALIIPGGESTTMALVAEREGLLEPLRDFVRYVFGVGSNIDNGIRRGGLVRG